MGNLIEEIAAGLDMWAEERAEERSLTWKERHAKGVPVIMKLEEWEKCADLPGPTVQEGYYHYLQDFGIGGGHPEVRLLTQNPNSFHFATFCNFRYKPEWLEKKGGANGHT